MRKWIAAAVVCCLTTSAVAQPTMQEQTIEAQLMKCRPVVDSVERLKCFDQIKAKPDVSKATVGNWLLDEKISGLDRSRVVTIVLAASKVSVGSSPRQEEAQLAIRCSERNTAIYVNYSALAASTGSASTPVQYRLGNSDARSATWDGSQNSKAYGLWGSQKAISFIKEMLVAPDFFIRGHAQSFGTTEASFDLAGLAEAIKPVRAECKW